MLVPYKLVKKVCECWLDYSYRPWLTRCKPRVVYLAKFGGYNLCSMNYIKVINDVYALVAMWLRCTLESVLKRRKGLLWA